ncbi:hypothetical protein [Roseateles sp. LYH14W]|uniref:TonB C-terminal domain-containing protein n=1 Tax=Pelomonas parva TaxID=3299032 RepID=A0ABW7EZP9_9BURK
MRSILTASALALCALGAHAQTALDDRSGEATLACLERPTAPKYPDGAMTLRHNGLYRVQVTFTDAKREPEVKVLFSAGSDKLREAAEHYAQQFRLPCLKAGSTVELIQEVSFQAVADGDVQPSAPLNLPQPPDARYGACLRTPSQSLWLGPAPPPPGSQREIKNGNLVVNMAFTAPDRPPVVTVVYNTLNARYRSDILYHVAEYRVPCLDPGAKYTTQQTFSVHMEGNRGYAFKDVGIVTFLGMVRNADARPVNFELDTMGCPFRLRFSLGRPAIANGVTETGTPNPNRRGFIAWMEELELALKPEQFESLLGAQMFIDVPCGTIKLG